jgi:hypothetical protein
MRIFNLLIRLIWLLLQLLLPIVFVILGWLINLMATSFMATVSGPRHYIDRLASEWTWRLIAWGIDRENLDATFRFCRFAAMFMIVTGWAIAALFTVVVLRVVFGFFI